MPMSQGWENSPEIATLDEALAFCGLEEFRDVFGAKSLDVTPESVVEAQSRAREQALSRADQAFAVYLQFLVCRTNLDAVAVQAFRDGDPSSWKNKGLVDVAVTLPSGSEVVLKVTYLLERDERKRGRKKRHGNRGPSGRGVYPVLHVLGIESHRRLTPLLEEEILLSGLAADAFRVGQEMIERHGFSMSWKGYLTRFHGVSGALFQRYRAWLDDGMGPMLFDRKAWQGQRIVICPDGGRMRLREELGGRPRASGYHGFDAPWREPKLFIIYAVDEEGNMLEEPRPIVDGIIGDSEDYECPADELFDVMGKVLSAVGVADAASVTVLGDGADWIWNRARPLLLDLGVPDEAVHECIDWYHVESGIWELSTLPSRWSQHAQISWRKRAIARLHDGKVDEVVELLGELKLKDARSDDDVPRQEFFIKHAHRLRYDRMRELNLPEGSGAIESVIRRVVNLRMKGNAKYWNEENAPHTMFLRAQLRTGRFDSFMAWSRAQQAWWWTKSDRSRLRYAEHGKEVRFAA